MSIRLRVTLATVVLVALALVAADFTAYALLRRELYRDANMSVRRVAATAVAAVNRGERIDLSMFASADRPARVECCRATGGCWSGWAHGPRRGFSCRPPLCLPLRVNRSSSIRSRRSPCLPGTEPPWWPRWRWAPQPRSSPTWRR